MTDMLTTPDGLRAGLLVTPGDEVWDDARRAWNLAVDQHPAAVALPESAEDVIAVVRHARRNGLRVAAQGTGHNAGPLAGRLEDAILVKTHLMRGVEIDATERVARVEAGALWMDVNGPAGEQGLAALAGSAPDVGVVGYTLGGGVSFLGRRYGLASNRVLAVELVNAEGELIRADRTQNQDLFWALRGGGGSFGVVTAMELELLEPGPIQAGILFFGMERAREVLNAWREWAPGLPDTVATVGRFLRVPPLPEIPEPLRGREFVIVEAVVLGDEAEAARLLAPIRALGAEMDTVAPTAPQDLQHLHMDPPGPVPGVGDGMLLDELTSEAVDRLVEAAGAASGSSLVSYQLQLGGGAFARGAGSGGALAAIEAPFICFGVGMAPSPEAAQAARADLARVRTALAPWAAGREYLNFAESEIDAAKLWDADTHARLRTVKQVVDPGDLFVSNHPV